MIIKIYAACSLLLLFFASALGGVQAATSAYPPDGYYTRVTVPALARPGYLVPVTASEFGTQIIRIADGGVSHHYSKDQPWNSDQTLIKLNNSQIIDGKTYTYLRRLPISSESMWSTKDPNKVFSRSGNRFYSVDARTGAQTTLHTFTGYTNVGIGPSEGNISTDDATVALLADDKDIIVYDIVSNMIIAIKSIALLGYAEGSIDWVSVSQSGKYVAVSVSRGGVKSYDRNLNPVATLFTVAEHGDLGYDAAGNEVFVQVGVSGGPAKMARLDNGQNTDILQTGAGQAGHMSCRNYRRPGWCYLDMSSQKEVLAIKLDGSQTVERFAHHRSSEAAYAAQAMGVPNPDGTKVMFRSDWNGTATIDSYIASMP